jgi:hypothetical protein
VNGVAGEHHGSGAWQDQEARHKTVETILAEAALANAQLAVAKVVLNTEFRCEGATAEETTAKTEEAVEKIVTQLVLGQLPAHTRMRRHRAGPEVKVDYLRDLVEARKGDGKAIVPATEQSV